MRKLLALYVTPLIGVTLILIKLPAIDKWLDNQFSNAAFVTAIILAGATILNHIITIISPFKKFERLEKNKWSVLDALVSTYFEKKVIGSNKISANVMMLQDVFYTSIEPNTKFIKRFLQKRFDVIWVSNNGVIDKRLRLTKKQGVSGLAYATGRVVAKDMTQGYDDLNLNSSQSSLLSGKGFIISCPVYAFDERYNRISNKKIVGIVNFSCSNLASEKLLNDPKTREYLTDKIVSFSKICSLIM